MGGSVSREFVVLDSGQRDTFQTGSRRDTQEGKGDFDLIPWYPVSRTLWTVNNWVGSSYRIKSIDRMMRVSAWTYGEDHETIDTLDECAGMAFLLMQAEKDGTDTVIIESRLTSLPYEGLRRVGEQYRKGGTKYGRNNWRAGFPFTRMRSSLRRHASEYGYEMTEDHLAAIVFNCFCLMQFEHDIREGLLPPDLNDLYYHQPESRRIA